MQLSYNYYQNGSVLGDTQAISSSELVRQTNERRATNNLEPLTLNDELSQAAFMKGRDMLGKQYWAHTAPDGTTPWHWFTSVGYNYNHAGENLAKNFSSPQAVVAAWMASPAHRENVLGSNYKDIGVAVVNGTLNGKATTLVVALYGEPISAASEVAGAQTEAAAGNSLSFAAMTRVIIASFTPAAYVALLLLLTTTAVALLAHFYRKRLPKQLQRSWYRHHGLYKAVGVMSFVVVMVSLYGGGQI